ncbi:uncharacterized protein LOC107314073 isoform X2 [Coturnix japonica]|uniref:uncharacterized protein LOC107314073 isoform X2 n=1 Tax=Coturnix japonica TaxID=93934 RepID=UPI0013A5ECED|nr:uncharacterized protein LOC107314073 isoform X2 [Coturnix japonica]
MVATSLRILLATCVGCLATDPSNVVVTQTPTEMHLSIGDSTEIACTWEKSIKRYRISWYLVNKENITRTVSSKLVRNATREFKDVLVIEAASANDTGLYYCEIIIEIPFYKKAYGNGTMLVVEEREAQSLERNAPLVWVIIPIITCLAAVGSLYFCYKKKQKLTISGSAQLPAPQEGHQEEQALEVAEIYGRTESTREEAGWAVSTLYNSLDSFYDASNRKMMNPPSLLDPVQQISTSHGPGQMQSPEQGCAEKLPSTFDNQNSRIM